MSEHGDHSAIEPRRPGELVSDAATVDARKAIKIEERISIDRSPSEVYAIWRNFDRLPEFTEDLESVTAGGDGRSHWVAKLPGGKRVEWDAELVNDIPNQLVAWKTVGHPDVAHAGSVHFDSAPDGRGTVMRFVIDYEPPAGRLGALIAAFTRLFGQAPEAKIRADLRRFKERLEGGTSRR
jgi:uncharacterized membrane protein